MREILFRGKAKDKWVSGYYVYQPNNACVGRSNEKHYIYQYHFLDWSLYEYITTEVDPNTVCQFTGILDINKIKIFEGDIIKARYVDDGSLTKGVVNFSNGCFCVKYKDGINNPAIDMLYNYEVIGNLHDNPELL